jgi:two-component system NtrC family sensor kinase
VPKNIFLFIGLFCLLPVIGNSQMLPVDSLKNVIKTLPAKEAKVDALIHLCEELGSSELDAVITYAKEAVDLARQLDYQSGEANALKRVGLGYFFKGDLKQAEDYWQLSLDVFQAMGDMVGVSNMLSNLGAIPFNQGDDPKALDYYFKSLQAAEKSGDKMRIVTVLGNIGTAYLNLKVNHDKALVYFSRALSFKDDIEDENTIATINVNMGEIYLERSQLDSAMLFFEEALEAYTRAGARTSSYALTNIGRVWAERGKHEEALRYFERAFQIANNESTKIGVSALLGSGNSHFAIGQEKADPQAYRKALTYFKRAFDGAKKNDLKREKVRAAEGLSQVYKREGVFDEALKYYEIYSALKDTLLNEESIRRIAFLDAEYESEKKRQQIEIELRRQRMVKNSIGAGLVAALIFIGILVQYYRLKRIRSAEKFEAQRQLIIQDKMASLGQITAGIAHEIKNPLNFVTNFAEGSIELGEELIETLQENKAKLPKDQYELMEELAKDIQDNSKIIEENGVRADRVVKRMMEQARGDKGEPQQIDINTLVDENIVLAYHGYRGNVAGFDVQIDKQYQKDLPLVEVIPQDIGRVVLNLFNNACYALYDKQKQTDEVFQPQIQVKTSLDDGYVVIQLRDNGPGISEKVRGKIFQPFFTTKPTGIGNTGLGLAISHDLIVIGHEGALEVDSELGEFTEFTIRLPIR